VISKDLKKGGGRLQTFPIIKRSVTRGTKKGVKLKYNKTERIKEQARPDEVGTYTF
jgi:hypothetical protein